KKKKKEKKRIKKNNDGKKEIINNDRKPAPEDTPIIPGSARGLRITACRRTPETARAAPANNEIIILGKRKSLMISTFSFVPVNKPLISSTADTSILPVIAE